MIEIEVGKRYKFAIQPDYTRTIGFTNGHIVVAFDVEKK